MKKRAFNKLTRTWLNKKTKVFGQDLIAGATDEDKQAALQFIVKKRGPVLTDLVSPLTDLSWLACMGYLYAGTNGLFKFHCLGEHLVGQMSGCTF